MCALPSCFMLRSSFFVLYVPEKVHIAGDSQIGTESPWISAFAVGRCQGQAMQPRRATWWYFSEIKGKDCSHFCNNFEEEDLLNIFRG